MATIDVKDAVGDTVAVEKPLAPGRAAAAASRPVALSTEDKAAVDALATQTTLAAVLAKIIAAPATEAKQDTVIAALAAVLTQTVLAAGSAIIGKVGIDQTAGQNVVAPTADQDPIFDHANGTKASVTASATIITPPDGCKYVVITSDVDIVVNAAGAAAVDDGTGKLILGGVPETVPVTAATAVTALSLSGTATVRCMPYKVRA